MTTLDQIVENILRKSHYPREVVKFHVERIARKFKYELIGKEQNILSKEDAADVESITERFLYDRKGHEDRKANATQLLAIIPPGKEQNSRPMTKPLPIIGLKKKRSWFRGKKK